MTLSVVIFGASGDLTERKLVPALYRLMVKRRLPDDVRIVGVARSPLSDDDFRSRMAEAVRTFAKADWDPAIWERFAPRLFYVPADATRAEGLVQLRQELSKAEGAAGGSRLYYLAVAPQLYPKIATG